MDRLELQCQKAKDFPNNLQPMDCDTYTPQHPLTFYFQKLNEHENRLFALESGAALDFLEFSHGGKGISDTQPRTAGKDVLPSLLSLPRLLALPYPNDCEIEKASGHHIAM